MSGCTRVTIAGDFEAEVRFSDETLGIAVLAPKTPLAPAVSASFLDASPRLRSDVAVAGYSYEGALGAGAKLELTGAPRCAGNAVAFPFAAVMPGMRMEIIDVFEFNDEGKVVSMKAYWGPENNKA